MTIGLDTPILDLAQNGIAGLSTVMGRKLAVAVAGYAGKPDIGGTTVEDLLNYFPTRYEDRSNLVQIDKLYDGLEGSVELYTRVSGGFQVGRNRSPKQPKLFIFEITGSDVERRHKPVVVWWFVSGKQAHNIINYYKERFQRGQKFIAYGKWEWDPRRNTFALRLSKPDELEILPGADTGEEFGLLKGQAAPEPENDEYLLDDEESSPELALIHTGRRVPIYRKLGPFQTKRLREIIYSVIQNIDKRSISDTLPGDLLKRQKLISRADAVTEIHYPPENASIADYEMYRSPAHRRLIFEEFFWNTFALQLIRREREEDVKERVIEFAGNFDARVEAFLPFKLTGAQQRVTKEIFADMHSDAPMNRLLQGDVGSGKTIVAFLAMFAALESGSQAAMMAPTEILAEQHVRNAKRIFADTGYNVELLTGSMRIAEKRAVREKLAAGEIHVLIGTHAVIQEGVEFEDLGLAVVDEQHRFGVLQRAELRRRGYNPDILVMTATPIPRSLAMTAYGDLDVSVIDELPPGRTPVKTVVVGEDQRAGVYKGIDREIKFGRQVYVVYPLIAESEKVDLKAATKMFEELRDKVFPKYKLGLLHGKMKGAEKDAIMSGFVSGQLNILVSTTVIEVGVDVPNASLMVIEHAERFGLSQLHQLRGRVGRGAEQSFCVLLTGDKQTAVAKERLGIMEETSDGFKIAEKDLEIRGQGDILGTRQSGIEGFKIGNIVRDLQILQQARDEAVYYLTTKRLTSEASRLIEAVKNDSRFHLAGIG